MEGCGTAEDRSRPGKEGGERFRRRQEAASQAMGEASQEARPASQRCGKASRAGDEAGWRRSNPGCFWGRGKWTGENPGWGAGEMSRWMRNPAWETRSARQRRGKASREGPAARRRTGPARQGLGRQAGGGRIQADGVGISGGRAKIQAGLGAGQARDRDLDGAARLGDWKARARCQGTAVLESGGRGDENGRRGSTAGSGGITREIGPVPADRRARDGGPSGLLDTRSPLAKG